MLRPSIRRDNLVEDPQQDKRGDYGIVNNGSLTSNLLPKP